MNVNSEIKQISFDEFKKIDLKRIIYAQLDTGEILMINNTSNINSNDTEFKTKKEKNKNKPFTLPKRYFKGNHIFKYARSLEKRNKRINLISGWISLNDYNLQQKLEFYDKIPKRAKYWENESFDSSKTYFHEKRIKRKYKYNNYENINNYKPFPKDSSIYDQYNDIYSNNNYNQLNQYMEPNYLYQIALGPFYSLYLSSQQSQNYNNNNNQWEQYSQNKDYYSNQNYYNYYQNQINQNNYYDFQNNINEYNKKGNINSINEGNQENDKK